MDLKKRAKQTSPVAKRIIVSIPWSLHAERQIGCRIGQAASAGHPDTPETAYNPIKMENDTPK
jgi:hypothetical protein